ncbi:MAG: NADP-dependent oxidoreductase [Bacteroidota bacterium]
MTINKQLKLAERPGGTPNESTWTLEQNDMPSIEDDEILVKIHYVSLDPAMRGWMDDTKSYLPPVGIGDVMRALVVGEVTESKHDNFAVGTYVQGVGGVQQYVATDGKGWHEVDPSLAPLPMYLGVLGMTGMTAYFGLLDIGQPKAGETVLVSGAAGAVGAVVGQIAKIKGCRVVGIAGSEEKCQRLTGELGFDAAINYKTDNLYKAVREHCPKGVDVYFDNVGGEILDVALANLNFKGRIAICGAIASYNDRASIQGPKNYLSLLINRGRMEGFIVLDYAKKYQEAATQMAQWMMAGQLKEEHQIEEGIENFLPTFMKLFNGEKKGKLILKVAED